MRRLVARACGALTFAFAVVSAGQASAGPAKRPGPANAAGPRASSAARQPAKTKAQTSNKASRKPGTERGEANPEVRASISGEAPTTAPAAGVEAMREADGFLFPTTRNTTGTGLGVETPKPEVQATGMPPAVSLDAPAPDPSRDSDLAWLAQLDKPDLPFRWDARLVRYLDYFKNNPNGRAMAAELMKRSGRYVDEIQKRLRARNLPEDIAWLALVESGMDPRISSRAGAAGLWQFMPKAAAAYGLHIDRWVDERLDPERSTDAALDYLADLHTRFGRWELAFAAYNMGHGGLLTAIRKYNTNDYWELSAFEDGVPYETALYVPKILALAFVAHNRAVFGCDSVPPDSPEPFIPVAKQKPGASKDAAKPKPANLPTQNGSVNAVAGAPVADPPAVAIPITSNATKVTLRWGESLENLAADHATTESRIRAMNGLTSPTPPRPGTVLAVPSGAAAASSDRFVAVVPPGVTGSPDKKRVLYEVVWGDQIEDVARALGVSVGELCQWNDIDPTARLHGKMVLEAFVPKDAKLDDVRYVEAANADILTAGSSAFFDYFESKNGRKRVTVKVAAGDTWASIAKKNGITVALLERINQRSHMSKLTAGEQVVVYTHSNERAGARPSAKPEDMSLDDDAVLTDAPEISEAERGVPQP